MTNWLFVLVCSKIAWNIGHEVYCVYVIYNFPVVLVFFYFFMMFTVMDNVKHFREKKKPTLSRRGKRQGNRKLQYFVCLVDGVLTFTRKWNFAFGWMPKIWYMLILATIFRASSHFVCRLCQKSKKYYSRQHKLIFNRETIKNIEWT